MQTQIGSKVIYKDDFAILTGKLSDNEATIPYPTGFNKDNCVIISTMFQHPTSEQGTWGTGSVFNSSSYMTGSLPHRTYLNSSGINVEVKNILFINGETVSIMDNKITHNYKIVLMKIANSSQLSTGGNNNPHA